MILKRDSTFVRSFVRKIFCVLQAMLPINPFQLAGLDTSYTSVMMVVEFLSGAVTNQYLGF